MSNLTITMRPKTWEEMVGSEVAISAIKKELASGRSPIGWFFHGPNGTGKTTAARILARYIQPEIPEPDIDEFYARDVEQIREKIAATLHRPLSGGKRIYILDEAQRLSREGQDALLKPLEVAGNTVYIFCTTEPAKIIKGLRDRCFSVEFKGLESNEIFRLVNWVLLANGSEKDVDPLVQELDRAGITSPREVVMAAEKLMAGVPVKDIVVGLEFEAEYVEVARSVVKKDWQAVSAALKKLKPSDSPGIRAVVASYLAAILLNKPVGEETDALAAYVIGLAGVVSPDLSLAWSSTKALLYKMCAKRKG